VSMLFTVGHYTILITAVNPNKQHTGEDAGQRRRERRIREVAQNLPALIHPIHREGVFAETSMSDPAQPSAPAGISLVLAFPAGREPSQHHLAQAATTS
jgi:hypothetical protein